MSLKGKSMAPTLNERFNDFLDNLPIAKTIDSLIIPEKFSKFKRSDYLIGKGDAFIEVKSLETDPEHKAHKELEKHENRDEYPLFYGQMEMSKILKHLPDGEKINKKIYYKISRSIEQSFRDADKQLKDSKTIFGYPDAAGILVLLNENINIFTPETIFYRINNMLTKKDDNKTPHYRNIAAVWLIAENFSINISDSKKSLPLLVIEGPMADSYPKLDRILKALQVNWANYNGVPLIKADAKNINDLDFVQLADEDEEKPLKRQDMWRKQYRDYPYLRQLPDESVLSRGAEILSHMTPHFLKNGKRLPFHLVAKLMEEWTHFLEEVQIRGLDLKKLPKINIPFDN